jgi:anti-sigma B factor antagonist
LRDAPPPDFEIDVHAEGEHVVVSVSGELDMATATWMRETILELHEEGKRRVVADLGAVSFIDCQGLNALVALDDAAHDQGWDFVVRARSPMVARLLALSGLGERFAPHLRAAVGSARQPAATP